MIRIFSRLFGRKDIVASKCGHKTKLVGSVSAFGDSKVTSMPQNSLGSTDYCLDCISKMAIQCAWCGEAIFIGDPITLYTPKSEASFHQGREQLEFVFNADLGFKIPNYAIVYGRGPLQLVGCLRWDCAESGADRAGFWIPGPDGKGQVRRVKTAYEQILTNGGRPVFIDDLSDSSEAEVPDLREGSPDIPIARVVE